MIENKAAVLLIELDTPGGLVEATREIVKEQLNSKVPVIVFVGPRGARAGSAGVFITLAGHVAAMAPGTNIGAAHPIGIGAPDFLSPDDEEDEIEDEGESTRNRDKLTDRDDEPGDKEKKIKKLSVRISLLMLNSKISLMILLIGLKIFILI